MTIAITRAVPTSITRCELTHLERQPIDFRAAERQHLRYEETLAALGCEVRRLPATDDFPDSVFVEDTAIVLDEIAIITRPGAESRRGETASAAEGLRPHRPLAYLEAPATLDGGDVLRIGKRIYVGISSRTDEVAVKQLRALAEPLGYHVSAVGVDGCLHLKSAVTALPGGAVLLNPNWVDASLFSPSEVIAIDPAEAYAANVLTIGDDVICAAAFPRTNARIASRGYRTHEIDVSELAKAEGALTCCSIIVDKR